MELTERYVLEINAQRSITKAAKAIGISQPALSASLTKLETELGYAVFNRRTSPLTLTAEGRLYIRFLENKMLLEKSLAERITELHEKEQQTLRIGAPDAYVSAYILPVVGGFLSEHPESRLKIAEGTVSALSEMALKGELDLFISTTDKLADDFLLEKFADESVFLCSKEALPVGGDGEPAGTLFDGRTLITLGESQPLRLQSDAYLEKRGLAPSRTIEVDQTASAVRLVSDGCGICFATDTTVSGCRPAPELFLYRLPAEEFPRRVYLAVPRSKQPTKLVKAFMNALKGKG